MYPLASAIALAFVVMLEVLPFTVAVRLEMLEALADIPLEFDDILAVFVCMLLALADTLELVLFRLTCNEEMLDALVDMSLPLAVIFVVFV